MSLCNTLNDNIHNANNDTMTHQIKRFLKKLLTRSKKHNNTYKKSSEYRWDEQREMDDNVANELLENQIFEEIDTCEDYSAVQVYGGGQVDLMAVSRGQRYVPVHFARTEAGTFFWTSITAGPDCDVDKMGDCNPITTHQVAELQVAHKCRWAQA